MSSTVAFTVACAGVQPDPSHAEVRQCLRLLARELGQDTVVLVHNDVDVSRPLMDSPGFAVLKRKVEVAFVLRNSEKRPLSQEARAAALRVFRRTGAIALLLGRSDVFDLDPSIPSAPLDSNFTDAT